MSKKIPDIHILQCNLNLKVNATPPKLISSFLLTNCPWSAPEIKTGGGVVVAAVGDEGSAAAAGVLEGDWLLAVNNQDVSAAGLEEVMARIVAAPRALNLRFARGGGA